MIDASREDHIVLEKVPYIYYLLRFRIDKKKQSKGTNHFWQED